MRRSLIARPLIAGAVVVGGMTSGASATAWAITGASAGGNPVTIINDSVLFGGSIGIGQSATPGAGTNTPFTNPGSAEAALAAAVGGLTAGTSAQNGALSFFGFRDSGGSGANYFGFMWRPGTSSNSLTFTTGSTASATSGVFTNLTGITGSAGTHTVSGTSPDGIDGPLYYFLWAGLNIGDSVTFSGTVANTTIRWLGYPPVLGQWVAFGSGDTTGGSSSFALTSATLIPVPAPVGLAAAGLAAGVLAARRMRKHAAAK
jgi:hypothetical protein